MIERWIFKTSKLDPIAEIKARPVDKFNDKKIKLKIATQIQKIGFPENWYQIVSRAHNLDREEVADLILLDSLPHMIVIFLRALFSP